MARTWDEVYRESLFRSGVKGDDQTVDASMLAKARRTALTVLDELDGEGIALPLFSVDIEFNTVSNQERYVLGTGTDGSPASAIRPEQIINAQIRILGTDQPVYLPLSYLNFADYRNLILVPRNQSQPMQYSWNPKWPQGELYLWPVPNQVWLIRLTCTLTWADVLGSPTDTAIAQLPSGFLNGFIDILALRLAEPERLDTETLRNKCSKAKYTLSTYSLDKVRQLPESPTAFPWNITEAGMNP